MPDSPGIGPGDPAPGLTAAALGEHGLIARLHARIGPPPDWVTLGIGDDAAIVAPARNTLDVLTTDSLVEGVHFDPGFSTPGDVGYKALAVNLSDVAAMGGVPRAALLALALPDAMPVADLDALVEAMAALARTAGVALVGGNIARSPGPLMVTVMVAGAVRRRKILARSGARPGDELFVSGSLGAAAAGLDWLRAAGGRGPVPATPEDPALQECVARHRRPEPRLRLGALLGRTRAATACIDLSDGLADGIRQLAAASGVGALVEAGALPVHPGARAWLASRGADPVEAALSGGEDYELLFAVPPRRRGRLRTVRREVRGLPLTRVGVVTAGPDVLLERAGQRAPLPPGFAHFRPSGSG